MVFSQLLSININYYSRNELQNNKKRPSLYINPSGAESSTFQNNYFNTMGLDTLAPWVARASLTMLLNMKGKPTIVFHAAGSKLYVNSYMVSGKSIMSTVDTYIVNANSAIIVFLQQAIWFLLCSSFYLAEYVVSWSRELFVSKVLPIKYLCEV